MLKFLLKTICVLVVLFIAVPFVLSLGSERTNMMHLRSSTVILETPDGKRSAVSRDEYLTGAAAAFMQNCTDSERLRAAYVVLNTPELTHCNVPYLSNKERRILWGENFEARSEMYKSALESVEGQSIILPNNFEASLSDCIDCLLSMEGTYIEILSALFPEGGLKTEK